MVNIYSATASDDLSGTELELYHAIMAYRAQNGLPAIPLSNALTTTAGRHAIDTYENIWAAHLTLPAGANLHSWSDAPYYADHSQPQVMWDAPERLGTGYRSNGYEISASGYATIYAALTGWKNSPGHNAVILNQSPWNSYDWESIGIGVEQGVEGRIYHVWFGEAQDSTGVPRVVGGTGVDNFTGTNFRDLFFGMGGDDVLRGAAGNDAIDGGDGIDIAVYSGAWQDYQITQSGATFTIVDRRAGSPDGTDTLTGIETLRFADGDHAITVAPSVGPEIAVEGNGVDIADGDLTPDTADGTSFGTVGVGSVATHTFSVTNDGNTALLISKLKMAKGFVLTEALSASIAPGATDTFTVRMDTAKVGAKTGQITFTTNDPDEAAYNFALAGNVVVIPPEIEVRGNGNVIADNDLIADASDGTAFGDVALGSTVIHTFTVNNTGAGVLTTSKLKMPKGFVLTEGLSASIAPGGSDTFSVRVDTAKLGAKTGAITFTTNDPDETPFNFALSANVTAAQLSATLLSAPGDNGPRGEADAFIFDATAATALDDALMRHYAGPHPLHHFDLV